MGLSRRSSLYGLVLIANLAALGGCDYMGPAGFLGARDREINAATQAIATALDDAQRAKAYSSRGAAYSEKARYSRISHLIPNDEYVRLFDLAIQDHNQAVALNGGNAEIYFNRGQAYYDRGFLDALEHDIREHDYPVHYGGKEWFDAAAADFEKAVEKDPKYTLAFDRLGGAYEQAGEEEKAAQAYTQELAFDPLGKQRLSDLYCHVGFRHSQMKEYRQAAEAYQKSTEFGTADSDTCPYEPFQMLVSIYTNETRQYDKAWEAVHRAENAGRRISPQVIERLKKDSGRTN